MAGFLDRIAKRLGYEVTPSAEEAISVAKQQVMVTPDEDPDGSSTRQDADAEIGDPGTETWAELYNSVPFNPDPLDIQVYSDMRYGNGTCAAMFKVLQLPILATRRNVIPGPSDKQGKVAAFVDRVLSDSASGMGMESPMSQVLAEVTSAFWAGYKPMEIVWRPLGNGRIGIKKLAPRSPLTTKPVIDKHGNLVGAFQRSLFMSNNRISFIPREKLFWYTHRMEDGSHFGTSDFRAAYPHYESIRKLYIIDNKTHEVTAIPIRVAQPTVGGLSKTQKMEVFNKIKRVGLDTAILLPKDFELTEFGAKNATSSTRKDSIDHHTSQMAMSILAHFLQLGTNGQGTYNLSADQSDFFLQMVTAEMTAIADSFRTQVIAPLVRLNFGSDPGLIPEFRFADMTDHVRKTVEQIFLAIVQGGGERLSDEFIEALGKRVANELGLDLAIITRNDKDVPKTTVSKEDMDKRAMEKFKAQAAASGAAKAGPGRGNTSGGANQKVAEMRKSSENKASSKGNFSAGALVELSKSSDNARDFFGRMKLRLSNTHGVNAPVTPAEITTFLDLADMSDPADVYRIAEMAEDLVLSTVEEVD